MWQTKTWLTRTEMELWLAEHGHKYQWHEIFVNNRCGIEYRKLRVIDFKEEEE